MLYDRAEDMAATTKRHPSRVTHRTALDADGRILAMEIDVLLDGGAYTTLSPWCSRAPCCTPRDRTAATICASPAGS